MATRIVKKIHYCYAREYETIGFPLRGRVKLFPAINWRDVEIVAEQSKASLTISSSTENRQRFHTAVLKFNTKSFPQNMDRLVFLVEYTNGEKRVIGNKYHPYVNTEFVDAAPESVTENQLLTVSATWKSPQFIPIVAV